MDNDRLNILFKKQTRRGRGEVTRAQARAHAHIRQAFNDVSGVIEGLTALKELPGSRFDFTVQRDARDNLSTLIVTNIPLNSVLKPLRGGKPMLTISSDTNYISATGDWTPHHCDEVSVFSWRKNKATRKVVGFVARYAAKRGLVS